MVGPYRSGWLCATFGFAMLALIAAPAEAASTDYCVTCKSPDETYRCRVQGSGAGPSEALKLYCVIRTAKEGGHASCSAKKATSGCVGLVKVYTYDGPALPESVTSDPQARDLSRKIERNREAFEDPRGDGPKSLFELGGRAVDASRRGLRNAGSAIGLGAGSGSSSDTEAAPPSELPLPPDDLPDDLPDAADASTDAETQAAADLPEAEERGFARRSYDCVISFFRNCGGGE